MFSCGFCQESPRVSATVANYPRNKFSGCMVARYREVVVKASELRATKYREGGRSSKVAEKVSIVIRLKEYSRPVIKIAYSRLSSISRWNF